jgi:hypothetical protein
MNMEVIHSLAPIGLAVDHKPGAFFPAALFRRQFLGLKQQVSQKAAVSFFQFHNIFDMLFGDHQKMNRRLGGDVVEGQHPVILVHFFTGNLPGDNFAENAVIHNEKVYHGRGVLATTTPDGGNTDKKE